MYYYYFITLYTGNIKPADEIMAHVQYILSDSRPPTEHPLAAFTTLERDTGAKFKDKLLAAGILPISPIIVSHSLV